MATVASGLRTQAACRSTGGRSGSRSPALAGEREPVPAVADSTGRTGHRQVLPGWLPGGDVNGD